MAKLAASDGAAGEYLGGAASVSGSACVVGAVGDDVNGTRSGSAYIFDVSAATGVSAVPRTPRALLCGISPNPFNPSTAIDYELAEGGEASLVIHNVLGQPVRTLVEGHVDAGHHRVVWSGQDDAGEALAGGVYFVRLRTGGVTGVQRMTLVR